jgi:hypothetical protein
LTTEERLSDIVVILAHGLLWLDVFSVDLCSHIGSCAALAHVASWPDFVEKVESRPFSKIRLNGNEIVGVI